MLGTKGESDDNDDPRRWWSAFDFEHQPVRDLLYRVNEEVCRNYDVDGFEIDYFRNSGSFL